VSYTPPAEIAQWNEPFLPAMPRIGVEAHTPAPWPMLFFVVWLVGALYHLAVWFRQWRNMRALCRAAVPAAMDVQIPVRTTRTGIETSVFGILGPVLLLPDDIESRLTSTQLRAVLLHEVCHVRRRDNLTAAIQMLVEALFWFRPLVWWIGRCMVAECERACDKEVLRQSDDAKAHAAGILSVCRVYLGAPLRCVSGVTGDGSQGASSISWRDGLWRA
jgi:beta-lactamase regulating signal transducer with metallopeptidase domain